MKHLLQQDRDLLEKVLHSRRAVTTVTMPYSIRALWSIYLTILEDALSILNSLITYLSSMP